MKRISRDKISTLLQVLLVIFLFGYTAVKGNPESKENTIAHSASTFNGDVELNAQMIDLWEQHVAWNRNVMLCIVDELPGTTEAIERLQQNKIEIGNAIKPYYGDVAGDKLAELLQEHVAISVEVMKFAKEGMTTELQEANDRWYVNADAIASFLANINSYWSTDKIQLIIKDQLRFTTTQAICRINKDYPADIIAYDKAHAEVLLMAEIFANGIAKQFPEKMNPVADVLMINQ
ncbi:hypothetical protein WG954_20320 [Lacibacter sp. H375]|uniref:hypothetical protein n=1 Tax=Lacibacter sp. H375 TaxID=3133424 RepID=UPI0030C62F8B